MPSLSRSKKTKLGPIPALLEGGDPDRLGPSLSCDVGQSELDGVTDGVELGAVLIDGKAERWASRTRY